MSLQGAVVILLVSSSLVYLMLRIFKACNFKKLPGCAKCAGGNASESNPDIIKKHSEI